ncbi:hypothetical protein [Phormidium pseudopriestleyi]|nr:hypothetical protein [Phormidium pseudopriestleyi]
MGSPVRWRSPPHALTGGDHTCIEASPTYFFVTQAIATSLRHSTH